MNQYNVTRNQQFAVEAETADDAIKQVMEGKGKSPGATYSAQIRPPRPEPQRPQPQTQPTKPNG